MLCNDIKNLHLSNADVRKKNEFLVLICET